MTNTKITGIVLSGGKSLRMGTDKGLLDYKGKSLVQHAVDYLRPHCNEILISSNSDIYNSIGYPVIPDLIQNIGPIGGIFSCIKNIDANKVIVTACDMPEIPKTLINKMCLNEPDADLIYLKLSSGRLQPLPLVLGKKTYSSLYTQIESGKYKLGNFINECISNVNLQSHAIQINNLPKNINFAIDLKE